MPGTRIVTDDYLYRSKPHIMLGEQLLSWMYAHGVTQTIVAEVCRVDRRTVYRWIKGVSHIPRTVWPRLAQQFGDPLPHFAMTRPHKSGGDLVAHPTDEPVVGLWPADEEVEQIYNGRPVYDSRSLWNRTKKDFGYDPDPDVHEPEGD